MLSTPGKKLHKERDGKMCLLFWHSGGCVTPVCLLGSKKYCLHYGNTGYGVSLFVGQNLHFWRKLLCFSNKHNYKLVSSGSIFETYLYFKSCLTFVSPALCIPIHKI